VKGKLYPGSRPEVYHCRPGRSPTELEAKTSFLKKEWHRPEGASLVIPNTLSQRATSFKENCSFPHRKSFATPYYLLALVNIFDFFHVQGLHPITVSLIDLRGLDN
jgi:hypothetical protein